jgi:hypothetical protein
MSYSHVSLEYTHNLWIDNDEPSSYIKALEGDVLINFDSGRRARAGRFNIYVIDAEAAVNDRCSVLDVFDERAATFAYWSLYEPDLEFTKKVTRLLKGGERWSPNMLILDRMEILPKYRGQSIGLRALRCLQRQFSTGCGIVAMKPFPLQFEGGTPEENKDKPEFVKMRLDTFDRDAKRATAKLRSYYARLGFVHVPGTEFMVADPYMRVPPLDGK